MQRCGHILLVVVESGGTEPATVITEDDEIVTTVGGSVALRGSFLIDEEDGTTMRGKVITVIKDKDGVNRAITQLGEGDQAYQELMEYNDLCDMIQRQHEAESKGEMEFLPYDKIIGHKYVRGTKEYRGSAWNVLVLWSDGSKTWEPLGAMKKDDPFSLAEYAVENKLMGHDGWKSLRRYCKNKKRLVRMLKQVRAQQAAHNKRYKYGIEVPYSYKRALQVDEETGTSLWDESMRKELDDIASYDTFENLGCKKNGARPPPNHQYRTDRFSQTSPSCWHSIPARTASGRWSRFLKLR